VSCLKNNIKIYIKIYITYFAAISLFRSRLLSRATKIILYKALIRPVVSCGAEAWTLTKKEEQAVLIFERIPLFLVCEDGKTFLKFGNYLPR